MKHKGNLKKKKKKMMVNMEMESDKMVMEAELQKTNQAIKAQEVRSQNHGNSKYRKLILKAYLRELKYRFEQWKYGTSTQKKDSALLNKIVLDKMKKRLYKQAFDMFCRKQQQLKREEGLTQKTDDLVQRFERRRLRKYFNMFLINQTRNKEFRK